MPIYNHAYSLGFEVISEHPDFERDGAQLRAALLARLHNLTDEELLDACDAPFDTIEEEV